MNCKKDDSCDDCTEQNCEVQKKDHLEEKDICEIFGIINEVQHLRESNKEIDPDGLCKFGVDVACRSIRDKLKEYIETHIKYQHIPLGAFQELDSYGVTAYREAHGKTPE